MPKPLQLVFWLHLILTNATVPFIWIFVVQSQFNFLTNFTNPNFQSLIAFKDQKPIIFPFRVFISFLKKLLSNASTPLITISFLKTLSFDVLYFGLTVLIV